MCKEQQIMQYHYRELNEREREQTQRHIARCNGCRDLLQMYASVSQSYRQLPKAKVRIDLSRKIKAVAGGKLKRAPYKIPGYLRAAAIFVSIALFSWLLFNKHSDMRRIKVLPTAKKHGKAMEMEWQTDIAGKLERLKTEVSMLSENRHSKGSGENLSVSLKNLDARIHRFEMNMYTSEKSHIEHSLDVVKNKIYRLDTEIVSFE